MTRASPSCALASGTTRPSWVRCAKPARKGDRGFLVFEDNDLAVEWCENRLVRELPPNAAGEPGRLADSLLFRGVPDALLRQVEQATQSRVYAQGDQILRHGQEGDGRVFFIESGHVSILMPLQNGAHQRIASLGPGMEFGEMALLGQTSRSASVYADTEVRCRILEAGDFGKITDAAPLLKITVLREPGQRHGQQAARREPVDRRAGLRGHGVRERYNRQVSCSLGVP